MTDPMTTPDEAARLEAAEWHEKQRDLELADLVNGNSMNADHAAAMRLVAHYHDLAASALRGGGEAQMSERELVARMRATSDRRGGDVLMSEYADELEALLNSRVGGEAVAIRAQVEEVAQVERGVLVRSKISPNYTGPLYSTPPSAARESGVNQQAIFDAGFNAGLREGAGPDAPAAQEGDHKTARALIAKFAEEMESEGEDIAAKCVHDFLASLSPKSGVTVEVARIAHQMRMDAMPDQAEGDMPSAEWLAERMKQHSTALTAALARGK